MDSTPSSTFLPPPPDPNPNPNPRIFPANHHPSTGPTNLPTQPPDLHITLSTLKHLIHLSKTTIHSVSNLLPTTTSIAGAAATCSYNSNHRVPPSSLFRHHLQCTSSPATVDLAIIDSLHYLSSINNQNNNYSTQITLNDSNTDLCLSLNDYHTSLDSNFFYRDCPAVVTLPPNNNNNCKLTLPAVLSAECENDDIIDTIDSLNSSLHLFELLPSEYCNLRAETTQWNDYPSFYSHIVLRSIVCCYVSQKENIMAWMIVNSPFYGVVIDVFIRDHILLLFRVCLKAIVREATGYLISISKGEITGGNYRFECPVLVKVLMWLASQLAILYGDVNGKLFAINILKQSLLIASLKSLFMYGEQEISESASLSEINGKSASKKNDGSKTGTILVSQIAAAVAALHERFVLETRIRALRASRFVPVYQRVQEHDYISKIAEEERKTRSNYRPIIEHDGVLWHRGGNQDSNKNKSREELLAEERDYKRRRMSYRGKKMKRSTTQVMRDIIDEYMEEIKHANMANQPHVDSTNHASEPSSVSNLHAYKHRHDENKDKNHYKESVSDISTRSENEIKEKSNKHRHDRRKSSSRSHDHSQQDEQKRYKKEYLSSTDNRGQSRSNDDHQRSKHKNNRSLSSVIDEFEDRYDPSKSCDIDD